MRLFFAVPISPEIAQKAIAILQHLEKKALPEGTVVRWARPEQLHLTLKFLGSVEDARVPELVEEARVILSGAAAIPFALGALAPFPKSARAHVIAADVTDSSGKLSELALALDSAMASFGIPRETREFHPHLTFGRLKSGRFPRDFFERREVIGDDLAREVILFESKTLASGSVYREITKFFLRSSAG